MRRWIVTGSSNDVWLLVVPWTLRAELLREPHSVVTSEHLGEKRTLCCLRQRLY